MDRDEALDQIVAEHAIGRIMQRYGLAVDAQDMDAFRACFHADAKLHYGNEFSGSLDEGIAWLRQQLPKLRGTMHAFMPSSIDLDLASGTAQCDTYAITVTRYPADADGTLLQAINGTRYIDRFECRDGDWRIAERRNLAIWSQVAPETELPQAP